MKQKLLLIFTLAFCTITAQEVTHFDFDTYNPNVVFNSWNSSSTFAKVANPASDATNASNFVGQFTAGDDNDIGIGEPNRKRWLTSGKCSFQPEEREWYSTLLNWGLKDAHRKIYPDDAETFSWFDYRSKGFDDTPKRGLRIDHILLTPALYERCIDAGVSYDIRGMEKPSDHAPIWADFNTKS